MSIIDKFMKIDLYRKANMRIGEIANDAEYRMDEQFQDLVIFGAKFRFSKLNFFLEIC